MTKLLCKYLKKDWHQHAQAVAGAIDLGYSSYVADDVNSESQIIGLMHRLHPSKPLFCVHVGKTNIEKRKSKKEKRRGRRIVDVKKPFTVGGISEDDLMNLMKFVNENNRYQPFDAECRYEFALVQKRFLKFGDYILPPNIQSLIFRFCLQTKEQIYPDGKEPAFQSKFKFANRAYMCMWMHQGEIFRASLSCDEESMKMDGELRFMPLVLNIIQIRYYIFFQIIGHMVPGFRIRYSMGRCHGCAISAYANFLKTWK